MPESFTLSAFILADVTALRGMYTCSDPSFHTAAVLALSFSRWKFIGLGLRIFHAAGKGRIGVLSLRRNFDLFLFACLIIFVIVFPFGSDQ